MFRANYGITSKLRLRGNINDDATPLALRLKGNTWKTNHTVISNILDIDNEL